MDKYLFKAVDSNGKQYWLKVKGRDYREAAGRAMNMCYKTGLCFWGRHYEGGMKA